MAEVDDFARLDALLDRALELPHAQRAGWVAAGELAQLVVHEGHQAVEGGGIADLVRLQEPGDLLGIGQGTLIPA